MAHRGRELDANLVALEVVSVELAQDLVHLVDRDFGVDVHEAEFLDDVSLDNRAVALEHLAKLVVSRVFSNVADEEFFGRAGRLPRSFELAPLNLDASPLSPDILFLKNGGSFLRQSSNPVCGSSKTQANSPWAKQPRA